MGSSSADAGAREKADQAAGDRAAGTGAGGGGALPVVAAGAAVLVVLLLGRGLPASEPWLLLRVSAAVLAVLVLPGALVVRLLHERLPAGLRLGAALAWSLLVVFVAQAVAFVVEGSLVTTALVAAVLTGALVVLVAWRRGVGVPRRVVPGSRDGVAGGVRRTADWPLAVTVAVGLVMGAAVAWARVPIGGDALEHLARTRKLAELSSFDRVGVTELFADAALHPGYAFPLWHAAMALVARLAGVDSAVVIQLAPAALTPLALLVVHGLGRVVLRSRAAGTCTAVGQATLFGAAAGGIGTFAILSGPATASLLVLAPLVTGLVLAHADSGRRRSLSTVAAASFALTVIHPSYTLYVLMVLLAYAVARTLLDAGSGPEVKRVLVGSAAVLVAAAVYGAWLAPEVARQPSVAPGQAEVARALQVYGQQVHGTPESFALVPEAVSRLGPAAVLGLLGVPLALLAPRRRWGAFVLSGAATVLLVVLVPALFTLFSDAVSVSQARRLVNFLPFAVAFAGMAVLGARLGVLAVGVALGIGLLVERRYPGDFTYSMSAGGGPAWPVWVALAAVVVAAVALPWARRRGAGRRGGGDDDRGPARWPGAGVLAVAVAAALALPTFVAGLGDVQRDDRPRSPFSRALLQELRRGVPEGSVVFADDSLAYRVVAYAPVYVNTAEGGHVWDRREERHRDAVRFFTPGTSPDERLRLLEKYDADYVLARVRQVERNRLDRILAPVLLDGGYVLFEVPAG